VVDGGRQEKKWGEYGMFQIYGGIERANIAITPFSDAK